MAEFQSGRPTVHTLGTMLKVRVNLK
uniref:Uncharacterized protein n=1 Tax=Anguilla anguilla TaxID=7936 RepID=A0A0E9VYV4_ANGAN